ncbi:hypothetical protein GCM10012286_06140 [Streptomyces lasiicapitis]|uniref:Uncharacterized protein n=1 Tax=Streptomyces lasiicapitis TaxID=1923961 RepID=A0ABQ2LIR3_9ACTN|nr:hypothetical protein GCM10012286_06140 [Streptomyces lasiicapitis]
MVRDSLEILTGRGQADPCVGKDDAKVIGAIGALMCVAADTNRLAQAVESATLALRATTVDGHHRPRARKRRPDGVAAPGGQRGGNQPRDRRLG